MGLINDILGKTTDRGISHFAKLATNHNRVSDWMLTYASQTQTPNYQPNFLVVDAVDRGNEIMLRLMAKLEYDSTDEVVNDAINAVKSLLILKYFVAYMNGMRLNANDECYHCTRLSIECLKCRTMNLIYIWMKP